MPTTAATRRGNRGAQTLRSAGTFLLYAALLWPAVSGGAHAGWPLAATQLLVLLALLAWTLAMATRGRLEWRRTALDLPLGLLLVFILLQLAVGNGPLRDWALAAPAAGPPGPPERVLALGTVSPAQTTRSLLLFMTYAAVYALVVNLVRRRRDLDRLVRILLLAGGVLAFLSLVDYLSREPWVFHWRQGPPGRRLTGPFANPDHWASWLLMLACLGVGYLAALKSLRRVPSAAATDLLRSPAAREGMLRRSLPAFGVALMTLAAVLTLSRGALLAGLAAGLLLLLGLGRVRGARWSLSLAAVLGAVILGYALWIGIDPLLARFGTADHMGRWVQWWSSVPMLASFPVLGVGLGGYKDIYFRFQPVALLPGRVYFPYAHSDLLQFVIETGPLGALLLVWAGWRVGSDLVGAHLFGRGSCPVSVEGRVRRSDPYSLGIMLGALGAVTTLLAHSAVDFSARIPAVGVLAAACLGIATVAAHTRFGASGARSLSATRVRALGGDGLPRWVAGATAALVAAALVPLIVEQAMARPAAATVEQIRHNLASTPTDPYLHERLAWALEAEAAADPARSGERRAASLAHMQRAVTLQPENPYLRRSLAALALAGPDPAVALAIESGRAGVERDPALLGGLVDALAPLALTDAQWTDLVPPLSAERANLASQLESRGLLREALSLYERALERASAAEEPVIRWALARLLLGVHRPTGALAQVDTALARSPGNPELLLTRAQSLEALHEPGALAAYRAALSSAEGGSGPVFPTAPPRLGALVAERLGGDARFSVARYRRALAQRLTDESRWEAARAEWERARAEAPLDAEGEFSRGRALDAMGDRAGAMEAFRRAVALDPTRTAFRARLAARLWENDRYMQAISEWQTIASQEPGNVGAHLALARAYLKIGDRVRAVGEYDRVLSLQPGQVEAREFVVKGKARP
jgi:tetratricopeptide (TPR) repeat protein